MKTPTFSKEEDVGVFIKGKRPIIRWIDNQLSKRSFRHASITSGSQGASFDSLVSDQHLSGRFVRRWQR